MMKKALSLLLVLVMLLSLCACDKDDIQNIDPDSSSPSTTGNTEEPTGGTTQAPADEPATTPTEEPTAKSTEAPAATPTACSHSYTDATCTAPKTCKVCGATEGNVLSHNYQNGVCGSCESWQFGYGKWQFFRVDGDTLYIVTLHGNDKGALTGISNSHYQDVDTVSPDTKDQYLQAGAQLVTYGGKSYLPIGGLGDPCFFETDGEMITVHLGEQGASMGEYILLQRTAKDQFTVKQIVGCTAYGITEGATFVHQNEA